MCWRIWHPVVQAKNAQDREAAIKSLCEDKSSMQRIQYGSALFNMASDVYNKDLLGGVDQEQNDPTRPDGEDKMITIQRQYNAFGQEFYGQAGPETGGVCRHASILVMDFLDKCGFQNNNMSTLGYSTADLGGQRYH